jgi:hypothetical protein
VRLVLVVDFLVEVSVVLYENTRHNRPTATINTRPATIPVYPQIPQSDMLLPPFLWGRVSKPSARRPYANSVVMMRSLPPTRSLGVEVHPCLVQSATRGLLTPRDNRAIAFSGRLR